MSAAQESQIHEDSQIIYRLERERDALRAALEAATIALHGAACDLNQAYGGIRAAASLREDVAHYERKAAEARASLAKVQS